MRHRQRNYLILSIIAIALFFISFLGIILLRFLTHEGELAFLFYICLGVLPVSALLGALFTAKYIMVLSSTHSLISENLYSFGEVTTFFDLNAFRARVGAIKAFGSKKKKQFIIAFTAANKSVTENINRDESVNAYNLQIANYIDQLFLSKKNKRNNVYCFSRGIFILYVRDYEERQIRELVDTISTNLLRIAQESKIRIWVQPFFGICEMTSDSRLVEDIENAMVARNVSERNFETMTYYHESFRHRTSTSDVEEITEGLKNNEFVVYYQPKFSLSVKRFVSSEALVRWHSPKNGILTPAKFIPIAEAAGLIHEIDTYVFEKVCQDLNEAKRKGRRIIPVSINFSLYEFYSNDFLNSIINILDKYQINPSYIEIEITEATSQANTFISISIIKKLRDRGVRVLMDDFGIGFSNIGNLRKMPFDAVKIDKSYIDDIVTDMKSRDIVKFLIELCKASDLEVIAEGVDNKDQVDILRKLKCDTIQGFYYSEALPVKEYEKFLVSNPFERREDR